VKLIFLRVFALKKSIQKPNETHMTRPKMPKPALDDGKTYPTSVRATTKKINMTTRNTAMKNGIDRYISDTIDGAMKLGARKYRLEVLSILDEIDRTCAFVGNEMIRNHTPDEIYGRFTGACENLKRLIHEIETTEATNAKTNQLEA
jgi:hypothetical protein